MLEPIPKNQPPKNDNEPKLQRSDIFLRYQDPTGELTTSRFKLSYWLVAHKVILYRLAVIVLIVTSVITWGYTLISLGLYLSSGLDNDLRMHRGLAQFPNLEIWHQHFDPLPFNVFDVSVLPGGVNKSDLVALMANPNERWLLSFDYYFIIDGQPTPTQSDFLLPGDNRPVVYLGYAGMGSGARLMVENIAWKRISPRPVLDPVAWQSARLNFKVTDPQISAPGAATEDLPSAYAVRFTLTNDSAYGYKAPRFYVGLYQSNVMVGIMPLNLANFPAQASANLDLRSFVSSLTADNIQVFPRINLYQPANFLPPPH